MMVMMVMMVMMMIMLACPATSPFAQLQPRSAKLKLTSEGRGGGEGGGWFSWVQLSSRLKGQQVGLGSSALSYSQC